MNMSKILPFSAVMALTAALAAAAPLQARTRCDRTCLGEIVARYLDSLVAHDPNRAPLADHVRFTEDGTEMAVGEGFWKTATKLRVVRATFLDPKGRTAAAQAVMEEDGKPVLFAARLRVIDRRITEIESLVVHDREQGQLFSPGTLAGPSEVMNELPPKGRLDSRKQMIEIALKYPAGLRAGSFAEVDAPFAPGAYRLENGVRMAGPGCTFDPPNCEDIRGQKIPTLPQVKERVLAVDERSGAVLLWMDFGPGSMRGPSYAGKSLVTFEAFKVYGGSIRAVEAVFKALPAGRPSGWN